MFKKMPLWMREICWFFSTIALYFSLAWFAWAFWSASLTDPISLYQPVAALLGVAGFFWLRRQTRRVVRGPLYRHGMKAHVIGPLRYT